MDNQQPRAARSVRDWLRGWMKLQRRGRKGREDSRLMREEIAILAFQTLTRPNVLYCVNRLGARQRLVWR